MMKIILALTDFSENATCAAQVGLALCKKLGANLLLFHTCIDYSTMGCLAAAGWTNDECCQRKINTKLALQSLSEKLAALCDRTSPDDQKSAIHWQCDDGDLGLDVTEIINHQSVELIVMGARSSHPNDVLYGDDTNAVINDAGRPVLIVPSKTNLEQIHKIIFATDFDQEGVAAIRYLIKLSKIFNWHIEIIHVIEPGERSSDSTIREAIFRLQVDRLRFKNLSFRAVKGKEVLSSLSQVTSEPGREILALLHHQHSFFIRYFARSKTKKALSNQKSPLLVFPLKMK